MTCNHWKRAQAHRIFYSTGLLHFGNTIIMSDRLESVTDSIFNTSNLHSLGIDLYTESKWLPAIQEFGFLS